MIILQTNETRRSKDKNCKAVCVGSQKWWVWHKNKVEGAGMKVNTSMQLDGGGKRCGGMLLVCLSKLALCKLKGDKKVFKNPWGGGFEREKRGHKKFENWGRKEGKCVKQHGASQTVKTILRGSLWEFNRENTVC